MAHPSALASVARIGLISEKFDIGDAYENLSIKSKFDQNWAKILDDISMFNCCQCHCFTM